jgi:hypothetical protein
VEIFYFDGKWEQLCSIGFGKAEPLRSCGPPGDNSSTLLWRLEHGELPEKGPSVVVIMVGMRDLINAAGAKYRAAPEVAHW